MANNIVVKDGGGSNTTLYKIDIGGGVLSDVTIMAMANGTPVEPTPAVNHDAVDSGGSFRIGARAVTGLSGLTLVANNDRTDVFAGLDGAVIYRPHCGLEDIVSNVVAITDGSSTAVLPAVSGAKNYVTTVIMSNSSNTAAEVNLRDGAAGTVKATFPCPALKSGVVTNLQVPLPFSSNTAVCADPDAALTSITVTLIGFKSKV